MGDAFFKKMGLLAPRETENPAEGVDGLTGVDADRFKFKVPTLHRPRNQIPDSILLVPIAH